MSMTTHEAVNILKNSQFYLSEKGLTINVGDNDKSWLAGSKSAILRAEGVEAIRAVGNELADGIATKCRIDASEVVVSRGGKTIDIPHAHVSRVVTELSGFGIDLSKTYKDMDERLGGHGVQGGFAKANAALSEKSGNYLEQEANTPWNSSTQFQRKVTESRVAVQEQGR